MSNETFRPDPFLRRSVILADLGIDASTLDDWVKRGDFPVPEILNPGQKREIIAWRTSTYLEWKNARPQRSAKPITANAYTEQARAKGKRTRAARSAAKHEASTGEPAVKPPDAPVRRQL
jgi:predicted DNA-binding transcriptional regulator AlpA